MDEYINPKAELERYIIERTCEWCDRTFSEALAYCFAQRQVAQKGYLLKHSKRWRICSYCSLGRSFTFDSWIFPAITSMLDGGSMADLLSVQPMTRIQDMMPEFPIEAFYGAAVVEAADDCVKVLDENIDKLNAAIKELDDAVPDVVNS